MPRWLRRFLVGPGLTFHLKVALLVGLALRLLSAYFVYGPQALDDYKHGVWPAYQFFAGLPLEIPQYRSHLLVWVLGGFVHVASWFGAESALAQVRAMYAGLGVVSLGSVFGAYLFASGFRSRLFSALTVYWMALFPLMPFVGTRAFGEALALGLVTLAFGILEQARSKRDSNLWWFAGFAVLGLASLFRFHVGLLYLGYMVFLLWRSSTRGLINAVAAGAVTTIVQVLVDLMSGKAPMETLLVYLHENEGGAAKYGVSPWYNPLVFVLAVSLAPFSFTIMRNWRGLWRRCAGVVIPFALFLVAHSMVPHKEERFLYPILGLEFILVCYLWASAGLNRWARRVYTPAVLIVGGLALLIVCFVNTQEGEIEPPAYVESHYGRVTYLDFESLFGASRFQFYFLRPPSVLEKVDAADFNAHRVDEALRVQPQHRAVVLLTSHPEARDQLRALEGVSTMEGRCLHLRTAGSIVDRALYKLNPKHNQRRRPTWYLVCERNGI
jgi:hypothetical protein